MQAQHYCVDLSDIEAQNPAVGANGENLPCSQILVLCAVAARCSRGNDTSRLQWSLALKKNHTNPHHPVEKAFLSAYSLNRRSKAALCQNH